MCIAKVWGQVVPALSHSYLSEGAKTNPNPVPNSELSVTLANFWRWHGAVGLF